MKDIIDFILAAMPFVLMGISIIIACVKKFNKNTSFGMMLGMSFGIVIGNFWGYLGIGMSAGMLLGEIVTLKSAK